jgi:hypothetical protein
VLKKQTYQKIEKAVGAGNKREKYPDIFLKKQVEGFQ